jgi:hypothetical protein
LGDVGVMGGTYTREGWPRRMVKNGEKKCQNMAKIRGVADTRNLEYLPYLRGFGKLSDISF